jgi:hypothetical protein
MVSYNDRVFINVPFDRRYKKLFEALVFAVHDVESAIAAVRNWLNGARGNGVAVPGPRKMAKRYLGFRLDLPAMCRDQDLDQSGLSFIDYRTLVTGWLDVNEW